MTKFVLCFIFGFLLACGTAWAQEAEEYEFNDEEIIYLKNRWYVGLQTLIPQGDFNANKSGWMGGLHLGYWNEISYNPWILVGASFGADWLSVRTDITENPDGFEEEWTASTINLELMANARVFPFREMLFNPYFEGHIGPSIVNTYLNYDLLFDVDRSDFGLAYRAGGGLMLNLKNAQFVEVGVFWADSTLRDYWLDDERSAIEFANPFANFRPFRNRFEGILIQASFGMSF